MNRNCKFQREDVEKGVVSRNGGRVPSEMERLPGGTIKEVAHLQD